VYCNCVGTQRTGIGTLPVTYLPTYLPHCTVQNYYRYYLCHAAIFLLRTDLAVCGAIKSEPVPVKDEQYNSEHMVVVEEESSQRTDEYRYTRSETVKQGRRREDEYSRGLLEEEEEDEDEEEDGGKMEEEDWVDPSRGGSCTSSSSTEDSGYHLTTRYLHTGTRIFPAYLLYVQ